MVTIDELRIWSAPRTADEIDAAMDDIVMCSMADLVAYFGFGEETMNAFADCTGVTPISRPRRSTSPSIHRSTRDRTDALVAV